MATLSFDADSAEVSATGATKVGSSYVLDGTSAEILIDTIDYGAVLAGDHSTVTESLSGGEGSLVYNSNPIAQASSEFPGGYDAYRGFDTDLLVTSGFHEKSWITGGDAVTNQRINYDSETITNWYGFNIANLHNSGAFTDAGVKDIRVYLSSTSSDYASTVYGNVTATMTLVFDGQIAEHPATDTPSWEKIAFIASTSGRYLIVDCVNNWGYATLMGFRRIQQILSGTPPTATYQSTDDEPPTNFVPVTPEDLTNFRLRANTGFQTESIKVFLDGPAGSSWGGNTIDTYSPDVTPPSVPTISNVESVGVDPNLGFFSDWVEPTDADFSYVRGQLNVNATGWLDIDNTASLGGATPMKFGEYLAGTQAQDTGWLYQNHYARNGYNEGATAQVRYRSVDTSGNESTYITSGIITLSDTATASDPPQLNRIVPTDGGFDAYFTASNELDTIYARTRRKSKSLQWTARSETFKRVGSGVISITGLTNSLEYDVAGEEYNGGCYSAFSNINTGAPDGDAYAAARYNQKIVARDGIAQGELYTALQFGERVTFTNTGEEAISIYVVVQPTTHTLGVRTGQVDKNDVIVTAPRQTNFPPDQFNPNARILLGDTSYQILTVEGDGITDLYSGVFTLTCSVFSEFDGY